MATFTRRDQETLDDLLRRKAEFEAETTEPVHRLVSEKWPFKVTNDGGKNQGILTQWLIRNAESLRDVLKPFETWVRPAPDRPQPLTPEQIKAMITAKHFDGSRVLTRSDETCVNWYKLGVRDCEEAHNIKE